MREPPLLPLSYSLYYKTCEKVYTHTTTMSTVLSLLITPQFFRDDFQYLVAIYLLQYHFSSQISVHRNVHRHRCVHRGWEIHDRRKLTGG